MGRIIGAIILGIVALVCLVFGILQLNEKGFLFNNAHIYASREDRKKMDKKPYYKQSGIVFILISVIFAINVAEMLLMTGWLLYLVMAVAVIAVIYAVVSSGMNGNDKK